MTRTGYWFLTDGIKPIAFFSSQEESEREREKYRDDPDFSYYYSYPIKAMELDEYPDELDLVMDSVY